MMFEKSRLVAVVLGALPFSHGLVREGGVVS